jgi:hypothetical protein
VQLAALLTSADVGCAEDVIARELLRFKGLSAPSGELTNGYGFYVQTWNRKKCINLAQLRMTPASSSSTPPTTTTGVS